MTEITLRFEVKGEQEPDHQELMNLVFECIPAEVFDPAKGEFWIDSIRWNLPHFGGASIHPNGLIQDRLVLRGDES